MKRNILLIITLVSVFAFAFAPLPTSLRIEVRNELGNLEEGVSVTIYRSKADYDKEVNPVQPTALTDKKGRVTFKDIPARVYHVNAIKGDMDNYGAGVATNKLEEGKLNKVTIIISE